jgi:hypothetical protein
VNALPQRAAGDTVLALAAALSRPLAPGTRVATRHPEATMTTAYRTVSRFFALAALSGALLSAAPARADEASSEDPQKADQPQTESRWYGYQTLATDGAALAFGLLSAKTDGATPRGIFGTLALGSYLAGGPIVHLGNGHPGKALGSFGLRTAVPVTAALLGGALGAAASTNDGFLGNLPGTIEGMALGLMVGVVTASVVDAAVLARETVPHEPPPPPAATISPTINVARDANNAPRTTLGVVGVF